MFHGKKIFVSKQAGIGDVLLITPILAEIKRLYPSCKIILMTFANAVNAMDGLPFIDEIFAYDKKKDSSFTLFKKLWGCDVALLLDLQYRPAILSAIAQIPVRVGISHKRKFWLTHSCDWEEYMDHTYEPYVFSDVLRKTIGLEIPYNSLNKLYISNPQKADIDYVNELLRKNKIDYKDRYLVCSPLTAHSLKNWELSRWNELFQKVYEKYKIRTVIFGDKNLNFNWDNESVVDISEKTNLRQVAVLIKRAKLLVNSCSLPVHIANAVDTQSIILYGYTDYNRWASKYKCEIISANLSCSPCDGYIGTDCLYPKCMEAISVEMVMCVLEKYIDSEAVDENINMLSY